MLCDKAENFTPFYMPVQMDIHLQTYHYQVIIPNVLYQLRDILSDADKMQLSKRKWSGYCVTQILYMLNTYPFFIKKKSYSK